MTYVLTHHPDQDHEGICFRQESIEDLLMDLTAKEARRIWPCGGAQLVQQAIENDLIDRYHISIIPTILDGGIPLFTGTVERPLKLVKTGTYNGIVDLVYERR